MTPWELEARHLAEMTYKAVRRLMAAELEHTDAYEAMLEAMKAQNEHQGRRPETLTP